jgi:hypothetical protein
MLDNHIRERGVTALADRRGHAKACSEPELAASFGLRPEVSWSSSRQTCPGLLLPPQAARARTYSGLAVFI